MMSALIKSKERVRKYGEVFTPPHIVKEMLDILETENPGIYAKADATFLEPAAGDGNFLVAILRRKLSAMKATMPKKLWARESLFVLASIYGIELLKDNWQDSRYNMAVEFLEFHLDAGIPCGFRSNLFRAARRLIDLNIIQGNTLTGIDAFDEPITLSWWHRVTGDAGSVLVQRDPFIFNSLGDDAGMDFTQYHTYEPCRIDRVHLLEPVSLGQVQPLKVVPDSKATQITEAA